jgi:outer membrane immunogenic protein
MKNVLIATALATLVAVPANAKEFAGPRLEVTAGAGDASRNVLTKSVQYGVGAGYDVQFGKIVAGVEAGVDNVLDRRNIAVAGRLGYAANEGVLLYTKVGYSNWKPLANRKLEGLRIGAGVEAKLLGPVFGTVEYRHTDFGAVKTNGGLVGVGLRF